MKKHFGGEPDEEPEVHNITDAREPHSSAMHHRMVQYGVTMSIRVVCLLLIFVVDGWMRWACIIGAIVLPYFAVILANRGSDVDQENASDSLIDHAPQPELGYGNGPHRDDTVHGEYFDDPRYPGQEMAVWYQDASGTWFEGSPADLPTEPPNATAPNGTPPNRSSPNDSSPRDHEPVGHESADHEPADHDGRHGRHHHRIRHHHGSR